MPLGIPLYQLLTVDSERGVITDPLYELSWEDVINSTPSPSGQFGLKHMV